MTDTPEQAAEHVPSRRLVRRRADRKIAGVAAGLGDHFGIDPIWIRLGFFVFTFTGGLGIVAYLALWILMPASDEPSTAPRRGPADLMQRWGPNWLGAIAIALGILIVGTQLFEHRQGAFWGLALLALGVLLFRDRVEPDEPRAPRAPAPTVPAARAAAAAGPEVVERTVPTLEPIGLPLRPRRPRERSPLGVITAGGVLVLAGIMWFFDQSTGVTIRPDQYLAAAVLTLGAGLLVGAWWGRARWLVLPGLLLVPALVAAGTITVPFEGGHGSRSFRPTSFAALQPEYRMATGRLHLDLSRLDDAPAEPVTVVATIALGGIDVYAPRDLPVLVVARVGVGSITQQGRNTSGTELVSQRAYGSPGEPAILLDLEASIGTISVWRIET